MMWYRPTTTNKERTRQISATRREEPDYPTPVGGDDPTRIHEQYLDGVPKEYHRFKEIFREKIEDALPKHQPWDHEINLKPDTEPRFGPLYPMSEKELQAMREYLDLLLKKGYIRPSQSSAGSPVLFVPKPGGKLRLCVDYRSLNDITIKDRYPLPRIDELRDRLSGARFFTKLDLRDGYHLIRIKEGHEWKTAFRTRYGLYEYLVMPFGLTNAPATFQALVNHVLREYLDRFCTAYLDDILIYSETLEEHKEHVSKVLQKLLEYSLSVKPEKCTFHAQKVKFLGFIIEPGKVVMDPRKVEDILKWPEPRNVKEVQAFLGFANFYRRFIERYSHIADPLIRLTRKDTSFAWKEPQQEAFDQLKRAFVEAPVLIMFDPDKPLYLETDASDYAIGATLSQPDDKGRLHPIAYYSRKMSPAELNYEIHDKELLAIVTAFKEWRHYLEGANYEITVYSDHKNLGYFTTTKILNRRQVRWAEQLAPFYFKIHYRKGNENGKADALSRRADHVEGKPELSPAVLRQNDNGTLGPNRPQIIEELDAPWEERILAPIIRLGSPIDDDEPPRAPTPE